MLEITGIPKILCMILNNEKEYSADERSLRYTKVKASDLISEEEVELYNKWLKIFNDILTYEYYDFFARYNQVKDPSKTENKIKNAINKIAQEKARYMVGVFIPTTITYTVPFIQLNKIAKYLEDIVNNPLSDLEEKIVPYINEFLQELRRNDLLLTEDMAYNLNPKYGKPNSQDLLFKNKKHTSISLFSERNPFTGLNELNEYGVNVSYNMKITIASLAQFHRHRTMDFEMRTPKLEDKDFYIEPLLLEKKNYLLIYEWLKDLEKVNKYYPQGKLVRVNMCGTLKNLVEFVGKERACDRAFTETQDMFTNHIIPDIYHNLTNENLKKALEPYVGKLRCQYPNYECPSPCGHPRLVRKF